MRRFVGLAAFVLVLLMFSALPAGAVTSAQLKAKALSISNFPTGWAVDNSTLAAADPGCLAGLKSTVRHEVKVTVAFANGDIPSLGETVEAGVNAPLRYENFSRILTACHHVAFTSGGQTASGTFGVMSFPTVGMQSSAYALALSDKGTNLGADVVIFDTGSYVGSVVYEDLGTPDIDQVQAFVTEAVNKLEGKPTTTPTTT